ncbi:hypothetical protein CBS147321_4988 [Aspergillus niger]|nr:hypothetical protein CBS12448_6100 [Aspergillus niger]KAI2942952.1 hypothetical protein CBS147321_4988 [Aspergillus niger]KAI2947905.1 hypothetical protein CBS147322_6530 [Aspergillus niger]
MTAAGRKRLLDEVQSYPKRRKNGPDPFTISNHDGGTRESPIVPDPHETIRNDTTTQPDIVDSISSNEVEDILRLDLGTKEGLSRTEAFGAFLNAALSDRTSSTRRSRPRQPRFPGVTENTSMTNLERATECLSTLAQTFSSAQRMDFDFERLTKEAPTNGDGGKGKSQWSPLHFAAQRAAQNGHYDACCTLIERGADVNAVAEDSHTALLQAVATEKIEVVQLLLSHGADIRAHLKGHSCVEMAAYHSNPDLLRLLIQQDRGSVNAPGDRQWTPLHFTAQFDKEHTLETAQILIDAGANVNSRADLGVTPLFLAVQSNRLDLVKLLVDKGAEINVCTERDITPLERAIGNSNISIIDFLIDQGAWTDHVDRRGFNIVHIGAMQGDVAVLERVLKTGADIEASSTDGKKLRPIHVAINNDNEEIALTLLEHGAQP